MKHVCGIFLTGVVTVLLSIAPATAAAPVRITVSGRGLAHRIVITDLRATEAIINSLCAGQHAGHLTGRPAFALAVQWSNGPNPSGWRGTFYPAVGSQLAAVDIPDFKLYTTNAILYCDRRVAGPKGLKLLARYGVPTKLKAPVVRPKTGAGSTAPQRCSIAVRPASTCI